VQPAILFVGDRFESEPDFKLAKSMLLDIFRGKQVSHGTDSSTCIDSNTFTNNLLVYYTSQQQFTGSAGQLASPGCCRRQHSMWLHQQLISLFE
jgi:hypothetical protein